jgi:hypothetical protein
MSRGDGPRGKRELARSRGVGRRSPRPDRPSPPRGKQTARSRLRRRSSRDGRLPFGVSPFSPGAPRLDRPASARCVIRGTTRTWKRQTHATPIRPKRKTSIRRAALRTIRASTRRPNGARATRIPAPTRRRSVVATSAHVSHASKAPESFRHDPTYVDNFHVRAIVQRLRRYDLTVIARPGERVAVRLRRGTIVEPRGAHLRPHVLVSIDGFFVRGIFIADRVYVDPHRSI